MNKTFLGRGWKFPVQVDAATGRIVMSEFEDDIAEAIRIILRTSPGERVMRSDFGCDADRYVFGLTDRTTRHLIETSIKKAIQTWEPRVTDVEVHSESDPESPQRLLVSIRYVVRTTNNLYNLVYPYYLHEGIK
ncbi:GPW/gp25 family protein [Paenibacillus sp. 481]|uniref:GPW/gp25 family protein n=1 Tax=Paenibacillus sp. 481 TaxID=2835869 RepID=UPI001E4A3764|nr:GPW/gp25 family protein [Paenibacillus sp. 481]UHA73463.1 GPW/gp25 family protein [Paenibacillus sp. 481]